ncbi:16328_t:CDS:2 [Funneliformis geosporum]|uniref:16328_t:CDS:1 n=1 Tax=Funneliformis geosporum TaxID=1117311 RepID=A0A9W4WN80_9GLOM|nr:16328_t:CDS:2 [Funneliformis geosporum]
MSLTNITACFDTPHLTPILTLTQLGGKSIIWEICSKFGIAEGTILLFTSNIIVALKSLKSQIIIWPRNNYRQEAPSKLNKDVYITRKRRYAIHLQAVVDHCGLFTFYDIGYPAPAHDAKELSTKMATDLIEISLNIHNLVERLNDV